MNRARWRWPVLGVAVGLLLAGVLVVVTRGTVSWSSADDTGRLHTAGVAHLRVEVLGTQPHDRAAFTEGLELTGDALYESTGLAGHSQLRELDPATGALRRSVALAGPLFGEGLTVLGDRIWQLTWADGVAIERDRASLAELRRVPLDREGWGLCHQPGTGGRLVASDGTDRLTFRDPGSFAALGSVAVTLDGQPLRRINELECVDGAVWANVWKTDELVRIALPSGRVSAVVDAAGLLPAADRTGTDVLNGIAAVPGTDEFLLTGKLWPTTFRVRFVPA